MAIDRGYNDYSGYKQLTDKEIFVVTRLKSNAKIRVPECRPILKSKGLICDETIELTAKYTAKKCPIALRRIEYLDAIRGKHYIFLTTNFKLATKTIGDIYKARWDMELFFK